MQKKNEKGWFLGKKKAANVTKNCTKAANKKVRLREGILEDCYKRGLRAISTFTPPGISWHK